MLVTIFRDRFARTKQERELTRDELLNLIESEVAPSKHDLPLLKLATFGEDRTENDSLRHDPNVLQVYGVEVDYDGEKISFDAAEQALRTADIDAILYSSPSHTPTAPRWRVLFPFVGKMLPQGRAKMADRANAILGGELARESWTLSQSFYYGRAKDAAEFRIADIRGSRQLDAAPQLSETPYKKPQRNIANPTIGQMLGAAPLFDDLPTSLKRIIKTGDPKALGYGNDRSRLVFYVACQLARFGWDDEQIAKLLIDPDYGISAHCREQGKPQTYALKQAQDAREKVDTGWVYSAKGTILADNQDNIKKALVNLGATFSRNVFTAKGYVSGLKDRPMRVLNDHEVNELRLAIDGNFQFRPSKDFFFDMMDHLTHLNQFHPVVDYLKAVEATWDGVPRIGNLAGAPTAAPSWLTRYGQADDTAYTRATGRLMLLAAVRRVRDPGCKFDEIMVLVDPNQGSEKSTALATLAVNDEWFTDVLPLGADDRKIVEHLAGKWIVEYSELKGIRTKDVEVLKAFLSRKSDAARLAYDRMVTEAPRQSVFFASTNSTSFLKDAQNRRYWPIQVSAFDIPGLRRDVHQLWAEAATAESAGESIRLDRSLWAAAAEVQDSFRQEEPWAEILAEVFADKQGKIKTTEVWKILAKPYHQRHQGDSERLTEAMRQLGFAKKTARFGPTTAMGYVRSAANYAVRELVVIFDPITQNSAVVYADEAPDDDAPF